MLLSRSGRIGLVVVVAIVAAGFLTAFASYAARTLGGRTVVEAEPAAQAVLPAFTAEEERFAAALWPIHNEVKLAAIRVTFAGIRFASEGGGPDRLAEEIRPALAALEAAADAVEGLAPPAGLEPVHARYRRAVGLYREAARALLDAAPAGDGSRLLHAQGLSFEASEETLRVGDRLWPAALKPH